MRVIVCGDRNASGKAWEKAVDDYIASLNVDKDIVIQGGCTGIDAFAYNFTMVRGLATINVPANWNEHGPAAGPLRNQRMLNEFAPDKVIGFHGQLHKSKGTLDMLDRGLRAGKECHVCISPGEGFLFLINESALENLCNLLCSQDKK